MNSLLRNKRKDNADRRRMLIIGAVALVFIALLWYFQFTFVSRMVIFIGRPFIATKDFVVSISGNFLSYFETRNALVSENNDLRSKLFERDVKLTTLEALEKENTELKETLGRKGKATLIYTPVLLTPGFSPYDTFLVDGGKNVGIKVGDRVTIDGVIAVGAIDQVYPTSSVVKLYSTPGNEMTVRIEGVKMLAKAVGRGNGNFEIRLPRDIKVEEGKSVYVPNINREELGVVGAIEADVVNSFQTVLFALPVDIQGTNQFYIIRD